MIFDLELKAGLVFGLDTDTIIIVEEDEKLDIENPETTMITLYLGFVALHIMFN